MAGVRKPGQGGPSGPSEPSRTCLTAAPMWWLQVRIFIFPCPAPLGQFSISHIQWRTQFKSLSPHTRQLVTQAVVTRISSGLQLKSLGHIPLSRNEFAYKKLLGSVTLTEVTCTLHYRNANQQEGLLPPCMRNCSFFFPIIKRNINWRKLPIISVSRTNNFM